MHRLCGCTILFICLFGAILCDAQDAAYKFSAAIDIPQTGKQKLLQMSNGNTILFHFQSRKPIRIYVFDKEAQQISSHLHRSKILKHGRLDDSKFQGFYEINGEAVLFITQYISNKATTVRMRFNTENGILIAEDLVGHTSGLKNSTARIVLKAANETGYSIFSFSRDASGNVLTRYNASHHVTAEVPLRFSEQDTFLYIMPVGAAVDKDGSICAIVQLATRDARYTDRYKKQILASYLLPHSDTFFSKRIAFYEELQPYSMLYSVHPTTGQHSLLLTMHQLMEVGSQVQPVYQSLYLPYLLNYHPLESRFELKTLTNQLSNKYHKQLPGKFGEFRPIPIRIFFDDDSSSTIVSEEQNADYHRLFGFYGPLNYLGDIGITRLNANGEEVWGTVLQKRHYPMEREQLPYTSVDCFKAAKNTYIIYNDLHKNIVGSNDSKIDSLYDYTRSHAAYARMNEHRELTKDFLFGTPSKDEWNSIIVESADYDEKTSTYATLVRCRSGKNYQLRIAWCKFD